ncbi:MAG: threonine/serine exporter family protein [Clostridiales bacterium]|nr:threonine/serine exporter family protein [Clostridiales bacterium]
MDDKFNEAVNIAKEIVENGGEISRAEESLRRIFEHYGAKHVQPFVIPSYISVSAVYNGHAIFATRRIKKTDLNLGRLEQANNSSRKLCGESYVEKGGDFKYSPMAQIIGIFLATGSFCIYFGGSAADAFFSFTAGVAVIGTAFYLRALNIFAETFIQSAVAGIISFLPRAFSIDAHPDKIMIGAIMLLIPGMSIGISMEDMLSGNLIAGMLELLQALLIALAIAFGFALALILFGGEYFA